VQAMGSPEVKKWPGSCQFIDIRHFFIVLGENPTLNLSDYHSKCGWSPELFNHLLAFSTHWQGGNNDA